MLAGASWARRENLDSQPGHIDQIKQTNAGVVYRLIDQFGPISRIELPGS
jgi:transcriptional regulator of PTS gene